jgi:hypothetical protein
MKMTTAYIYANQIIMLSSKDTLYMYYIHNNYGM